MSWTPMAFLSVDVSLDLLIEVGSRRCSLGNQGRHQGRDHEYLHGKTSADTGLARRKTAIRH